MAAREFSGGVESIGIGIEIDIEIGINTAARCHRSVWRAGGVRGRNCFTQRARCRNISTACLRVKSIRRVMPL
ncbi:hypothetical protein CKO31_12700 [Thiohalocapsa halophila]|uniref:Uncharacterized protein n=1 Tax=Thiohalocapsa halophila TaxID=69359 RepID=A0ABS1CIC4_9GAMM|nr:hypothetical protein [Thiohalocapsa halophila]